MEKLLEEYLDRSSDEIRELFSRLRQVVFEATQLKPEEKLWAKLPSYYVNDTFVPLIPFKDHINIEAQAISKHREELEGYKITPKGMLQIALKQELPVELLKKIFAETFAG